MQWLVYNQTDRDSRYPRHPFVALLDSVVVGIVLLGVLFLDVAIWTGLYLLVVGLMFLVSAMHHWLPHHDTRHVLDRAMIYVLIAGTTLPYVPFVAADGLSAAQVLLCTAALFGMYAKYRGVGMQVRGLSAVMYIVVGFGSVYVMQDVHEYIGLEKALWFWFGVGLYALQLSIYTKRWCNWYPKRFGYREVQHLVLVAAAGIHTALSLSL